MFRISCFGFRAYDRTVRNLNISLSNLSVVLIPGFCCRALSNNLYNLGLMEVCREALEGLGADLEEVGEEEEDAALGNGGLGRLAACFLDSLATLDLPGYGYGIFYEYGLFRQDIHNGYQQEKPDHWLADGTPWAVLRPDETILVPIYGRIEHARDRRDHPGRRRAHDPPLP